MASLFHPLPKVKKKKGQSFPGQLAHEQVIFMVRRHWTVIAKHVARLVVAHLIALFIFIFLAFILQWTIPNQGPVYVSMVIVGSLFLMGAWLLYLYEFVDYHLDIWILTNRRIINIEQSGLFKRTVSELTIINVQDVTAEIHGKVQTFLNYGNVYIQTAGEKQRFVFEEVPQPQEISRRITKATETAKHKNMQSQPHVQTHSKPV